MDLLEDGQKHGMLSFFEEFPFLEMPNFMKLIHIIVNTKILGILMELQQYSLIVSSAS